MMHKYSKPQDSCNNLFVSVYTATFAERIQLSGICQGAMARVQHLAPVRNYPTLPTQPFADTGTVTCCSCLIESYFQ